MLGVIVYFGFATCYKKKQREREKSEPSILERGGRNGKEIYLEGGWPVSMGDLFGVK